MEAGELTKPEDRFTLDEVLANGWSIFVKKFWRFFGLLALAGLVMILPGLALFGLRWTTEASILTVLLMIFLSFVILLLSILMQIGIYRVQIDIIRGEQVNSDTLWKSSNRFWQFLGANILYTMMCTIGTIFFIVPGIILHLAFQFFPYFVIEHKLGPLAALKASFEITMGVKWELFFLWLILGVISGIGQSLLLIGVIPAEMFIKLTMTETYSDLLKRNPQVVTATAGQSVNMSEQHGLIE